MDQSRFDALARALGARATRRAGLAGLLAPLLVDAGAAARRSGQDGVAEAPPAHGGVTGTAGGHNDCGDTRPCPPGFACRKSKRRRRCVCPSGVICGEACCAAGETCLDGACASEPEPSCLPPGEACKNAGRPCCDGTVCGSGQGGMTDVACHVPAGGACATTADCVYGSHCSGGRCVVDCGCSVCPSWDAEANGRALMAAIAAATPGSTLLLGAGRYVGPPTDVPIPGFVDNMDNPLAPIPMFLIQRSVTLAPCGDGEVTLGTTWVVGAADVTLRGLTLVGASGSVADAPAFAIGDGSPRGARAMLSGCRATATVVCLGAGLAMDGGTAVVDSPGGGIIAAGCDTRLTGPVTVARSDGTGLSILGGQLRATGDVRIVDNLAEKEPGGILIDHGCAGITSGRCVLEPATVHLEGVTVSGNVTSREYAGGIQVTGYLTAVDTVVRGNRSARGGLGLDSGGGIVVQRFDCSGYAEVPCDPSGGQVTLVNSLVEGNAIGPDPAVDPGVLTADAGVGGGIRLLGGTSATLRGTRVIGNRALEKASGGSGDAHGGGIALTWTGAETAPVLAMEGCTVTGNAAEGAGAAGGGIWASDDLTATTSFSGVSGNVPDNCVNVTCV